MQSSARMRLFAALSILVLFLTGCMAPPKHRVHHSLTDKPPKPMPTRVVLLPIDITVSEVSMGGVVEEVEAWSKQAADNMEQALKKYAASSRKFEIVPIAKLTEKERDIVDEHRALYDRVALNAFIYTSAQYGAMGWDYKVKHFDYTLGDGLAFLRKRTGADAAFVVVGADEISSSGRKAAIAISRVISLGGGMRSGSTYLTAGLVDLKTGDVLWLNSGANEGGRDLREAEDAAAMIENLLEAFPGLEPFLQAAR